MKYCNKILAKTILWRIIASGTTFCSVLITEGTYENAGIITLLDITIKTTLYYFHEKVWDKQKKCFQDENGEITHLETNIDKENKNEEVENKEIETIEL